MIVQLTLDQKLNQQLNERRVLGLLLATSEFNGRVLDLAEQLLIEEATRRLRDLSVGVIDQLVNILAVFVFECSVVLAIR